jgi:hypothetical protein
MYRWASVELMEARLPCACSFLEEQGDREKNDQKIEPEAIGHGPIK